MEEPFASQRVSGYREVVTRLSDTVHRTAPFRDNKAGGARGDFTQPAKQETGLASQIEILPHAVGLRTTISSPLPFG
jgi:hypothetical protein